MSNAVYTLEEYRKLKSKYGSVASWAIWDDKELSDTSVIDNNFKELNANFVLLGLNISKPLKDKPWANFHGGKHDRKLKYACNHSILRGSYITDIFKGIDNPNSLAFSKSLNENVIKKNVEFFIQEMRDVKTNDKTQFIIFGALASKYFNTYFKKAFKNKIIHFRHYSARGTDKLWVEEFWNKLNIKSSFNVIS